MTGKSNPHGRQPGEGPDDRNRSEDESPSFEGDLNFASESSVHQPPPEKSDPASETVPGQFAESRDEAHLSDTWVPTDTPSEDAKVDETWVPPVGSSDPAQEGSVSENPDEAASGGVDQTWVPAPNAAPDELPPDPATDSQPHAAAGGGREQLDGTVDMSGNPAAGEVADDDFAATVVLPERPDETPEVQTDSIFEQTAIIDQSANDANREGDAGTVMMPDAGRQSASDSAVMATVVTDLSDIADQTYDFSQTMGMRGLSEEEYDEWQKEVREKSVSDTDVVDLPDNVSGDSTSGRRTQIWSKQSRDGLDNSLTIRSRPVAGDKQFEGEQRADKPDYRIVEKLAEGGMGAIYVASQTSLGREIAIKTLKPLRDQERKAYETRGRIGEVNRQRREMFLSEALVTANLVHPHIIPIHDLCETADNAPFYVMKRVHGTPWNERITEMSLEDNLEVLHKVCDAMAYAHHNAVVNRDLKPENIMLGEFGEVLVLDWGLAVPASQTDKQHFTSPSAAFGAGTPAYMSPELWTGPAEKIGTWSDVYLLGAILFEIVTGKAPHAFPEPGKDAGSTGLWKIIDGVVRTNRIRDVEESGELLEIALKAMSTNPEGRHASVLEFQDAIKSYQHHEESRHLAHRAEQTLTDEDEASRDGYQKFQTAAALYEESFNLWPDNKPARKGLRTTRLAYAELALRKGDVDLGLQVAARENDPEFSALRRRLTKQLWLRNGLKYATMVAVLIIVVVGAISFKQKQEITALVGTRESLEKEVLDAEVKKVEAEEKVVEAEEKVVQAEQKVIVAQVRVKEADAKVADADAKVIKANSRLEEASKKLTVANEKVAEVESRLDKAEDQLVEADEKLVAANRKVEAADKKLEMAESRLQLANDSLKTANKKVEDTKVEVARLEQTRMELVEQKKRLTEERVRADVDLRNTSIASLIRNADYATALQRIDELIESLNKDPQLIRLPEAERTQRKRELEARRRQLLRRTTLTEQPVQSQVIAPSGQIVVWGDRGGTLTVRAIDPGDVRPVSIPQKTLKLESPVSLVRISDDEKTVVAAAGNHVHLWQHVSGQHRTIDFHRAPVTAARISGDTLLVGDAEGVISAWGVSSGSKLWSIRSSASVIDVVLLPKAAAFIYAGSRGGQSADILAYRLPDETNSAGRPQRLGQLRLPRDRIYPPRCLAVSPDESLLLVGNSRNGEIMALPAVTRGQNDANRFPFAHPADLTGPESDVCFFQQHMRPVNDIRFSTNGRRIVTASDDRTVGVWDRADSSDANGRGVLRLKLRLEGHGARVNAAGFVDGEGGLVLSAGADSYCRLWDVAAYQQDRKAIEAEFGLAVVDGDAANETVEQKSRYLLTGLPADTPSVDDPVDHIVINQEGERQRGALKSIQLSEDGTRVVTGAADGTAVIWDTRTGRPVTRVSNRNSPAADSGPFEEGHDFNVAHLRFLPPNGNILLTTGFDGNLCLWNSDLSKAGAGNERQRVPGLGLVNALTTSSDGHLIVTSATGSERVREAGAASVWVLQDLLKSDAPQPLSVLSGFHRAEVTCCAVSPDNRWLATGALDGRVAVWDIESGQRIAGGQVHAKNTMVSHLSWIAGDKLLSAGFDGRLLTLALSADTKLQASESTSQTLRLKIAATFLHDRIPVEQVALSPDGRRFVTISIRTDRATETIRSEMQLWSLESAEPVQMLLPAEVEGRQPARLMSVDWSPDGSQVAVVVDGHLQLMDSHSWKVLKVLEAPGLGIANAVFAPQLHGEGTVLATFDGTAAHLWNLDDYSHMAAFRPLYSVQSVAIAQTAPSSLLLTGDRAIRIFDANPESPAYGRTLAKVSDPHKGVVTSLRFAARRGESGVQPFISTGADGSAAVWEWHADDDSVVLSKWLRRAGPAIKATKVSENGKMALVDMTGEIRLVDLEEPDRPVIMHAGETGDRILCAAIHPTSDYLALAGIVSATGESRGWIYGLRDGELRLHGLINGHGAGGINGIAFLPDSPHIVTAGADGEALIWNWQPARGADAPVQAYEAYQFLAAGHQTAHQSPITSLSVCRNGLIATAASDGQAIIWHNPFR